jgi:probable FeS assembly SUF system protein SufT
MTTHILNSEVTATVIPAGNEITLPAGLEVSIIQTLGGNVTVRTDQVLIGYDAADDEGEAERAGEFNEEAVWGALRSCFDPEIPLNIVDLGLVYDLAIDDHGEAGHTVEVKMTLTAPGCGMGPVIAEDARTKIAALPTVSAAKVHIVWDPIWSPHMISESGRKTLGLE